MRYLVAAAIWGVVFGSVFGPHPARDDTAQPSLLVRACQAMDQPENAAIACRRAIASGRWTGAKAAWAWTNLGLANAAQRRFLAAIKAYDRALEAVPDYAPALANRGNAHAALGDMLSALADHDRALALEPDNPSAWMNRGADREDLGQYRAALEDYAQAIKLDPRHRGAHIGLATARCKLGQAKASAEARLRAVEKGLIDAKALQVTLQDEGFYKGAIDGIFGKGSRAALRAWTRAGCVAPA
ncbi:MAG: tetratricopeptide repeat protein [Pseudomonadota bacterium]